MQCKPLESYSRRGINCTLNGALHGLSKTGANSTKHDSYAHKASVLMQQLEFTPSMKSSVSLLYMSVDLFYFMKECHGRETCETEFFNDLTTGRYSYKNKQFKYHEEMMVNNVLYLMEKKKIIFFQMGIPEYLVHDGKKKKEYAAHGVCVIMIPTKTNYQCYYINSHGQDLEDNDFFEFIMSRRRSKKKKLAEPADIVFMKSFVKYINNQSEAPMIYNESSRFTYKGANLQAGDGHGICFMYPLIIWHYFGKFYSKNQILDTRFGKIKVPTGKELIKSGNLNHFIESIFWQFCPKYFEILNHQTKLKTSFKKFSTILEKYIIEEDYRFVKNLIGPYISYIRQSAFKHNINN